MRILINKSAMPAPAPKAVAAKRLPVLADYLKAEDNNFALVRLLMALAVLVSHSWWLATGRTSAEPLHIWTNHSLGEHAVQVFFFLSGVVVAQSLFRSKSILDFACARALRIFPALIVCVLATALLLGPAVSVLGLKSYFGDTGLIAYIVKTLSLSTGSAPLPGVFPDNPVPRLVNLSLWTLKYEVLCYALLGLFGMLYLAWPKLRPYLTSALVLIIALIFVGEPKAPSSYTALDNVRYFVLFFGMGTLAYLFRERLVLSWLALPLLFLAFVFAIGTRYAEVTTALFLGYGTLLFATLSLPRLRWFTNDQDYSYAVYILHCPIQQALVQFKPGIDPIELTLVTLALVMPLSVFSWTHIERPAMTTRRALVGWLRSHWPAKAMPEAETEAAPNTAAKPNLLKQRVKSLALGRGSAVTPLKLGQSATDAGSIREESAMPRYNATMSQPDSAPPPAAAAHSDASSVTRSKVAEWFSRKRKTQQDPVVTSISGQFASRIKAAARQAGVEAKRAAHAPQTVTVKAEQARLSSETAANSANARKVSRTRRLSRITKMDPVEAGPIARTGLPQTDLVPTTPRTRLPRISSAAPTKLWARPSRMVMPDKAKASVQGATVRLADVSKSADLPGLAQATTRGAKPVVEVATSPAPAVTMRPSVSLAANRPNFTKAEPVPVPTADVIEDAPTARSAQPRSRPRVAAHNSPALRERLNRLMAKRNDSIHKRLGKQRSNPIPLA